MRVISSSYQYLSFLFDHQNQRRVQSRLVGATSMLSTCDNNETPRPKIEDIFRGMRQNSKQIFLLDGGTGEELFRRNIPDDRKLWSATALVHSRYHEILEDVHSSFLRSGSNAITTNSYGVVPGVGFDEQQISTYMAQSGKIARSAAEKNYIDSPSQTFVFGSLGPLVESYRPDMIMPHDEGVKCYQLACESLGPYVDAFIAETMSCVQETIQVLDALASPSDVKSTRGLEHHYLLISYSVDSNGNFRDGEKITDGIRRLLTEAKNRKKDVQILAILFNCSEPESISEALEKIHCDSDLVNELNSNEILLGAYAHKLTPIDPNWTLAGSTAPQPLRKDLKEATYWNNFVKVWIEKFDVRVVGGCCGITPEHIRYMKEQLKFLDNYVSI